MMVAPNFDRHPPFRAVLCDPSLDDEAKISRIATKPLNAHWRVAAERYGQSWDN